MPCRGCDVDWIIPRKLMPADFELFSVDAA